MENIIKFLGFIHDKSKFGIDFVFILFFFVILIIVTRKIKVDKKNQIYSYNDKQQRIKELEDDASQKSD